MSAVAGIRKDTVESSLASYIGSRGGTFRKTRRSLEDENTLVLAEGVAGSSVLYPWGFFEWDELSKRLSEVLKAPVFSFHIHDGDFWMYQLFKEGALVDQFNPIPEYWDDSISKEERLAWEGNADRVAAAVPGVEGESIRPYLRHWDLKDEGAKAFPDDEFPSNDAWQLCDFLKRLGFVYPVDAKGEALGETFEFVAKEN